MYHCILYMRRSELRFPSRAWVGIWFGGFFNIIYLCAHIWLWCGYMPWPACEVGGWLGVSSLFPFCGLQGSNYQVVRFGGKHRPSSHLTGHHVSLYRQ